jgi:hypothetical protein
MRERMDKEHIEELKEMIKEKENTEPVEKVKDDRQFEDKFI